MSNMYGKVINITKFTNSTMSTITDHNNKKANVDNSSLPKVLANGASHTAFTKLHLRSCWSSLPPPAARAKVKI